MSAHSPKRLHEFLNECSDDDMVSSTDVVQAQVDAFHARDAEAFTACYHADAKVLGPDGDVMVEGTEAIHGLYTQVFGQSPELHVNIPTRIALGDWVVDEEEASGFVFEGFPSELHAVVVYQVRDGLIVRTQVLT
jgi:hypothetical protein